MDINYLPILPFMPIFLNGALITLEISCCALLFGMIFGIIGGLLKTSNVKILEAVASFYTWIFRGTPLLVQLYIIYFGLPELGLQLSPFASGALGMALNTGAYITEIVRSGIQAVDKGQMEAALSLGMTKVIAMVRVIGPQAFKIALPPLVNQFIMTIKNSSMTSLVTITELFRTGQVVITSTFRSFEVYTLIAVIYLILTSIFMIVAKFLEKGGNKFARS